MTILKADKENVCVDVKIICLQMEVMPHSHIESGSQVYDCLYETEPGQIIARPNLEMTTKLSMQSPQPWTQFRSVWHESEFASKARESKYCTMNDTYKHTHIYTHIYMYI